MKIYEIREQKANIVEKMRGMVDTAEAEKRDLSADEAATFEQMKGEVSELEAKEKRAEYLDSFEKRAMPDAPLAQLEKRVTVQEAILAQLDGKAAGALAEYNQEAERRNGSKAQGVYVPMSAFEKRDVNTTTTANGIVPDDFKASEYIQPLRNSLVLRSLGIRTMTGLRGDTVVPKYKTGTAAGWVAENTALSTSGMTFDNVKMQPKHLGAMAEISRQLIQQSSPDINSLITDDLAFSMSDALDTAILQGDGDLAPLGLLNVAGVQTGSLATPTWADLLALFETLDTSNVSNAKFLTNPSVMKVLRSTEKEAGTGNYLASAAAIADTSATVSNKVPASTLILGDFSQFILGVWSDVDLLVNQYAESAYSKGNILIRTMMTVGTMVRHPEAFIIVDDVPTASGS